MIEFIISIALLSAGIFCLIWPRQIGVAFCHLGKASWRVSTFGLTDMRWFYPEEKAPKIFRSFGMALILFGVIWGIIAIVSVSGPGAFAAMRESRGYLKEQYGAVSSYNLSAHAAPSGNGDYVVIYRYGQRNGNLHATWKGDHYVFSETKEPNAQDTPANGSGGSPSP